MARIRKNKKVDEIKDLETVTEPTTTEPIVEDKKPEVVEAEVTTGKDYVVVLGTPSFYVVRLEDGTMQTIQGSNTYRRGDIVKL